MEEKNKINKKFQMPPKSTRVLSKHGFSTISIRSCCKLEHISHFLEHIFWVFNISVKYNVREKFKIIFRFSENKCRHSKFKGGKNQHHYTPILVSPEKTSEGNGCLFKLLTKKIEEIVKNRAKTNKSRTNECVIIFWKQTR